MKQIFFAILFILGCASSFAASLAVQADSAYNKEDYASAVRLYHQAIEADGVSPEVCYNLGNAYYRIGRPGRAVIYYERALALDPSMTDARTNLEFVNTRILDRPEDDSSFLGNLHRSISSWMSADAWAWTAFVLFLVILGCAAVYIFMGNIMLRKAGFFGGFILIFVLAYVLVIASQTASAYSDHSRAVVVVPTANMSTTPGVSSSKGSKLIPVHEGTRVEIIDSMAIPGDASPMWYDVKINNSTRAWVKSGDIERI